MKCFSSANNVVHDTSFGNEQRHRLFEQRPNELGFLLRCPSALFSRYCPRLQGASTHARKPNNWRCPKEVTLRPLGNTRFFLSPFGGFASTFRHQARVTRAADNTFLFTPSLPMPMETIRGEECYMTRARQNKTRNKNTTKNNCPAIH